MHTSRRRAIALVLAGSLALAACSDDGSGDDVATGEDGPTTTAPTAPDGTSTTTAPDDGPATGDPVPSAGCGTSEAQPGDEQRRTLDVEGTERWYLLTVPEAHDGESPVPLVLDFHGLAEGAEVHAGMTQYTALAKAEGFVVAFPNGTGEPVRWNPQVNEANTDHDFVARLLDTLEADLCLDTSRVYATGLSNGAMMASSIACAFSDRVAAIAPIAGVLDPDGCEVTRPVPVMAVHGTADPILGFNGGVGAIPGILGDADAPTTTAPPTDLDGEGHPATVAAWAERNGCDPEPTDTPVEDIEDPIIHRVYDCPEGAATEFYIIEGGGHSWPGSDFSEGIADIVGYTTFDLDATAAAWGFFQRFQLP